jgi:hypothetical protein
MPDIIDHMFGNTDPIDEYYPGSKKKRRPVNAIVAERKQRELEIGAWDASPQLKSLPNGRTVELFSMGALSLALGRPIVTLRLWERRGYIPRAPYRLKSMMVKGVKKPGWRMYSRQLIEATIEVFRSKGLLTAARIDWDSEQGQSLTTDLVTVWTRIHDQETAI